MKRIAFIPLRAGSKSIRYKNRRKFCRKCLFEWSLLSTLNSNVFDAVWVSTDDDKIKKIIKENYYGLVKIHHRSEKVSTDTASTEDVMLEFIKDNNISKDTIFTLVQATHPFTQSLDYKKAMGLYDLESKIDENVSILSVSETHRFFWVDGKALNYDPFNRRRRQDFQQNMYIENGGFYISTVKNILRLKNRLTENIVCYKMPEWTSYEIDSILDLRICEMIFRRKKLYEQSEISSLRL